MSNFTNCGNLTVDTDLYNFVNDELLEGTSISADHFWAGFDKSVHALVPRNRELLAIRQTMQDQIDSWLKDNAQNGIDQDAYEVFLTDIGYLLDEGPDFQVATTNVDAEIARVAGPQLVVPITNARYALNAAAHASRRALVHGAAAGWSGQVSVFASGLKPGAPCYRCWVPETPPDAEACDEVGVVGAMTGMVGAAMALETVKLITGAGAPLIGRILLMDGLAGAQRTVKLKADASCSTCGSIHAD